MARTEPARGMRDYLPEDIRRREYVIGVIPSRTTDRVGVNPESPCGDLIERALEEPQRGARREFIAQVAAEAQRQREHEYAPGVPLGAYYSILTVSPAPPAPPDGERRVYVNTFLGGVSDFRNAQRVIVRSGETREHTDIQLMSVTPTTIDGRVIFGDGRPLPRFAEVMLIVDERVFGMSYEASAFVDADGTFVFADVAPGHYAVEVAPHSGCGCSFDVIRNAWTRVPIDVPSTGAAGVVVPVDGPVTVSATVMLTGSAQAESAWLAVLSDDGRPDHDRSGAARQEDGGRVNIDDVSPGRYIVDARAISEDGQLLYLTSLTRGGVDLTTRALDVSGASVSDIVMTFADVPTPLSGIVIRPDGRSISDGVVVLFPVSPAAWPAWQPNSARFQSALVRHGRFEFMHVMAGEYFVVLKGEDESWSNAAEMKSLAARATPITVVGGQAKTVTVVSKR